MTAIKQFTIPCRLEFNAVVTVDAETAEEALAAFHALHWVDNGIAGAELVNYYSRGKPRSDDA